jgi:hypothetical protein
MVSPAPARSAAPPPDDRPARRRRPRRRGSTGAPRYAGRLVEEEGYGLVVIDTFIAFAPVQNENDAAQMMEAVAPLQAITRAGAALLLVHHPRKGDATEGQASRGSGALPGFVDVIIELRRYDPENRDDTRRTLTTYSRFDESPPEQVVELREDGYHVVGTKMDASHADRVAVITGLLPSEPPGMTSEEVYAAWEEQSAISQPSKATVAADLKEGAEGGRWTRAGAGKRGDPFRHFLSSSSPSLSWKKGNEGRPAEPAASHDASSPTIHLVEGATYGVRGTLVRAQRDAKTWVLLREASDSSLAGWRVQSSGALTELLRDGEQLIDGTPSVFRIGDVRAPT